MRWVLLVLFIPVILLIIGHYRIKSYPYERYMKWITGQERDKFYHLKDFRKEWLAPAKIEQKQPYVEDYGLLWKEFSINNTKIPLPVRHPLYQTVPILESLGKHLEPNIGIIFLNSAGEEICRFYTLPVNYFHHHTFEQDLFKLPYVKNRILKFSSQKLWKDLFSLEIKPRQKSIDEMIYDLYLLHLRSKYLPKETVAYGPLDEKRSMISFLTKDKKYKVEFIIANENGVLYSYVLRTRLNDVESIKMRAKLLDAISFNPVDSEIAEIIYKEFKQLNFARQIDQEGMLYLFSAWTQDMKNTNFFKEMIFYLERANKNERLLEPLYQFGLKHFGKTFTTSQFVGKNEDPNVTLQRKIELEEQGKFAPTVKVPIIPEKELSPDEKMNEYLKKAKEERQNNSEEAVVH